MDVGAKQHKQGRNPESRGDFTILISHIVLGCKFVAFAVNKAGLAKLIGLSSETNIQASAPAGLYIPRSIASLGSLTNFSCEIELPNLVRRRVIGRGVEEARRRSSGPSSAATAPYKSRILLVHFPSSVPVPSVLFSDPAPVHACSVSLCRRRTRRQPSWILRCVGSEHCLLLPWCELSFCYSIPEDCNACIDFLPGTASALIHPTAPPTSTVASQSEWYEYDLVLSRNVEILFQNLRIVMPKARV